MKDLATFFHKPACRITKNRAFYINGAQKMKLLFEEHSEQNAARTAILMSGTGSNAGALLE